MGPDIKADAFRLKVALEKADAENSHSGVRDVLQALLALPGMTEAVIRETKLGKALAGFKKKYDAEEPTLGKLIMNVLKQWTRIAKQAKTAKTQRESTAGGAAGGKSPVPAPTTSTSSSSSDSGSSSAALPNADLPAMIDAAGPLTEPRRKMVAVLVRALSLPLPLPLTEGGGAGQTDATETKADLPAGPQPSAEKIETIATGIEASCLVAHPCDATGKQADYSAKIRTLNFNLKKNATLRAHVLLEHVPVSRLLSMSADDMAGERLGKERAQQLALEEESRRQDWCALHEADIIKTAADAGGLKSAGEVFNFADEEEEVSDDD